MINPNGQYYPGKTTESIPMHDFEVYSPGIPIKLELASRFMAASMTDTNHQFEGYDEITKRCLRAADALITEFNNQQKEGK